MTKVITRFSPSPTGNLHIGGVRTAFYNWLFSKNKKGKFILRIEDTDRERFNLKSLNNIINTMKWLNIDWDEGPYYQSKRLDRYKEVIQYMLNKKIAYKCYCSKARLENVRKKQIILGKKPRYDRHCRDLKIVYKLPYVIRFKNEINGFVNFHDQIRGIIKFNNEELDDLILLRSNGMPTYNFCVAIDDWDMQITHVIRGEDHINNTPRQINILKSIGAKIPLYAHLSMVLEKNGKKFSKRSSSFSVLDFKNQGYLPQALLNYIVRLGWSSGNQEIFSLKELIKKFSLKKISKSSSTFDPLKLTWLNQYYIKTLPEKYFINQFKLHLKEKNLNFQKKIPNLLDIIKLLKNRSRTLKEMADNCEYFYKDVFEIKNANLDLNSYKILKNFYKNLSKIPIWSLREIKNILLNVQNQININQKNFYLPLRIAITGRISSPQIDKIIYIIGKEKTLIRIKNAIKYLKNFSY